MVMKKRLQNTGTEWYIVFATLIIAGIETAVYFVFMR